MKNFTKLLLATSMLTLSTATFAGEVGGSVRFDFVSVNQNKLNSVGIPFPAHGIQAEVNTDIIKNLAVFGGAGLDMFMRTKDAAGKSGIVSLKSEAGARYKINDTIKVGGGVKYSLNVSGDDTFRDVSITTHGRYTTKNNTVFQLDVSKSVTDEGGFGASFSAGQAF